MNLKPALTLSFSLGWQDLKQSYRRSALGPFWLTLGMAIQIIAIGLVFGLIFGSPLEEFLPFLATSLILWNFFSTSITDGSMAFINGEAIIRQLPIPHHVHILRALWKNLLMLAHNVLILPFVFVVFLKIPNFNIFLFLPGFVITVAFLFGLTYIIGLITTRYRDVQQIVISIMGVVFYVTPVIWQPSLIPSGTAHLLLGLNPFYHFFQIVRLPILGQTPTLENWLLSGAIAALAVFLASLVAKKFKNRLAYWV
jgi:ABC-type polysaccharide/polyol phosphate export permease